MEDCTSADGNTLCNVDGVAPALMQICSRVGFFGVYDGHNGEKASAYLSDLLPRRFAETCAKHETEKSADVKEVFPKLLEDVFEKSEGELSDYLVGNKHYCGSTGVTCTLVADRAGAHHLFCANVGDSRAVMSRGGVAVPLSNDHKIEYGNEKQRIIDAGGWIRSGRVNGVINLARTFGDVEYKALKEESWGKKFKADLISAEPEIQHELLTTDDEFIVLASDGIFDVMSDQAVVNSVRQNLADDCDLVTAAERLIATAINDLGSVDNCSVVVVYLDQRDMSTMRR